ncbi:aminoacyl-histidine dipeptidase [Geomonas sp.]|uniref:aminoacyl-histidine dipeptidase n=1 Tax=Geomonas sp. TaxID=2651584 RepID=UPI002B47D3BD|nr:aminoacyl-histidine dipeptidase [Geomonas sp.]HJV36646.1 aminoacyl-histidine dipeptidase [Geomonas sp.]
MTKPDAIDGLKPVLFWKCFAEISRIPRPSGHEERIAQFILERGKELGLETRQDACGNVLVKKPASSGREGAPSICLQSHLDMVCEKNAGKVHDFMADPIELVRNGNVVTANGTTLGADNGAGVATSLAIMEDATLEHGPLEMLFTLEEETGLKGALNLSGDLVQSRIMLNLDSEDEGVVFIGCAGGKDTLARWQLAYDSVGADLAPAEITVKGLKGGHSGLEIDKELGNAIKILNRALMKLSGLGCRVSSIEGGNMRNAIPRECTAAVYLPNTKLDEAKSLVSSLNATFQSELSSIDPGFVLAISQSASGSGKVLQLPLQQKILMTIASLPTGVQHMSVDMPGLVETSTNVSVIHTTDKEVVLITSQRSSVASRLAEIVQTVESILQLGGGTVEGSSGYPGWKPDMHSPILGVAKRCYQSLFGKEVEVKAVHAGLECGIIGERVPGMDMISFGPSLHGVHSPDEVIYIDSVQRYWDFLLEILRSVR